MRWWLACLLVIGGELVASVPPRPSTGWVVRTRRGNLHLHREIAPVIRLAIYDNNTALLQRLAEQGVDFNLPLTLASGDLPMVIAVVEKRPQVIEWLIANDVRLDNDNMFHTPLHATLTGYAWSLAHSDRIEADFEMLQMLLTLGADPNVLNVHQDNPLHVAARLGDLRAVTALCENGAEVDSLGCDGYTPFMHAAEGGWLEVAEYLLSQGANINAVNNRQESAAMLAIRAKHADLYRFFSEHADVDHQLTDRLGKSQRQWLREGID